MAGPDLYSDAISVGEIRSLAARGDRFAELMVALFDKVTEHRDAIAALQEGGGGDLTAGGIVQTARIDVKSSAPTLEVRVATQDNLPAFTAGGPNGPGHTLTGDDNGPLTVDEILLDEGDDFLMRSTPGGAGNRINHGPYTLTQQGVDGVSPWIATRKVGWDSLDPTGFYPSNLIKILEGNDADSFYTIVRLGASGSHTENLDTFTGVDVDVLPFFSNVQDVPPTVIQKASATFGGTVAVGKSLDTPAMVAGNGVLEIYGSNVGLFGATPYEQGEAIPSPTTDPASLKSAIDAIRLELQTRGWTL